MQFRVSGRGVGVLLAFPDHGLQALGSEVASMLLGWFQVTETLVFGSLARYVYVYVCIHTLSLSLSLSLSL